MGGGKCAACLLTGRQAGPEEIASALTPAEQRVLANYCAVTMIPVYRAGCLAAKHAISWRLAVKHLGADSQTKLKDLCKLCRTGPFSRLVLTK